MDLLLYFCQRWRYWYTKTCSRVRQVKTIQERSDYILGTYRLCFEMVGIRGVRNYPSDHFVLKAKLLICPNESGHQFNAGGPPAHIVTMQGGSKETKS